jgi:cell division ATPase FtsA
MIKLPLKFRSGKLAKEEPLLVLDIGTSSVKAALFLPINSTSLQLMSFYRQAVEDDSSVKDACLTAFNNVKSQVETPIKICRVVYGLSASVCHLSTVTAKITRQKPENTISKREVDKISEKFKAISYIEATKSLAEKTGSDEAEPLFLSSEFVSTKIDGVAVPTPEGYKGKEMECSLFCVYSLSTAVSKLADISRSLNLQILAITTNSYTVSKVYRDATSQGGNFILIDIGGVTTDVAIVFCGGIVSSLSVSLGVEDIVEEISLELKIPKEDAQKLLKMYSEGTLAKESSEEIQKTVVNVCKIWSLGLEQLFLGFDGIKSFPHSIILSGWGSAIPEYATAIEDALAKNIPFKNPPNVKRFGSEFLGFVQGAKNEVLQNEGATISLASTFLDFTK